MDFSFLEDAAPKSQAAPETQKPIGNVNVSIRVDADCMMQCDGQYVDVPLKAGMMAKTELPCGQHLPEFFSTEDNNIKVEKVVDWPESGKNYLVMVNELKAKLAPPMPQMQQPQVQTPSQNPYLNQLNQMQGYNPLLSAQQMNQQLDDFRQQMNQPTMPQMPQILENK